MARASSSISTSCATIIIAFAKALPDTRVFYAVKANPEPQVLSLLAKLGSCFDTASVVEIEQTLAAGATPDRISFGNTIKKERDIARAFELGVRLFAVDCEAEVEKIARAAPGSKVFCRILCDGAGAEWPLSRKFGCVPEMALARARACASPGPRRLRRVVPRRLAAAQSAMWDGALKSAAKIFRDLAERGIHLQMVNLGGGFPTKYLKDVPAVKAYGNAIFRSLRKHFGNRIPETIIEPGRGMVGNAGVIEAEVVLDVEEVGRGQGALGLSRHRQVQRTRRDDGRDDPLSDPHRTATATQTAPCVIAGPTCDFGRRALREGAVSPSGQSRDRRESADRGNGRLYDDLFVRRLQRLPAAGDLCDLTLCSLAAKTRRGNVIYLHQRPIAHMVSPSLSLERWRFRAYIKRRSSISIT